jgi:hypothetical protein
MIVNVWHCPKCGAELTSSGAVTVDGSECSVFQCDACVVSKPICGEPFDVALTFAIADNGTPFDPVDGEIL